MSFSLQIFASGSSGNAALLRSPTTNILIDAGTSTLAITRKLRESRSSFDDIHAIFLTHDHYDHITAIQGLKKHLHIPIFTTPPTSRNIHRQLKLTHTPTWQHFTTGDRFQFRDLDITTFPVPHDGQDPVGYTFSTPSANTPDGNLRLTWLPDMGHIPEHIPPQLTNTDILVIESNHCPDLLAASRRSQLLKNRISGRHGHLSNHTTAALLAAHANPRWRHIYLTHLSRDCNNPDAVERALLPAREKLTCPITIIPHSAGAPPNTFL